VLLSKPSKVGLKKRILRDITLGLAIIAASLVLVVYTMESGKTVPFNWISFAGFTPIIFWLVLKQLKRFWHKTSLWLATAALLGLHLLGGFMVLRIWPSWPGVWFIPAGLVEVWLMFLTLHGLMVRHSR
jgi:hypothetical protein